MSLLSAMFGAKPPYGTPPFSPPHENTGGAEVPTTPETLPAKHGLAGFIDRLAYPTNSLGQIGMALLAGGGGPLGNAAALLMQAGMQRNKHGEIRQVGNQLGVVDPNTGAFTPTYTAPDKPQQDDDFTRQLKAAGIDPTSPEGQNYYRQHVTNISDPVVDLSLPGGRAYIGPRSGMAAALGDPAPADAPPAGGTIGAAPSAAPGGLAPRGLRNNNPLNLTISPFTKSQTGFTGTDPGGRYATFDSPQDGLTAAHSLLQSYAARGFDTPAKIIGRWSPSSENGAATQNYVNAVSGRLGIGPNDPVPPERYGELISAMSDFENGRHGSITRNMLPGASATGGGMPKAGDRVGNYRFIGGDPNSRASWVLDL